MDADKTDKNPAPAAKAKPKKAKKVETKDTLWSRRDFFSLAGWASFTATFGLSSLYFLRLLFPRVLFEPSPLFKAGNPDDYTVGEVSTKYVLDQRVWGCQGVRGNLRDTRTMHPSRLYSALVKRGKQI